MNDNELMEINIKKILIDFPENKAFLVEMPNSVTTWIPRGSCSYNEAQTILTLPKWLYQVRKKEGRWNTSDNMLLSDDIMPDPILLEPDEKIIAEYTKKTQKVIEKAMLDNGINIVKNNTDPILEVAISMEDIMKNIIPPTRSSSETRKSIQLHLKTNKLIFSRLQLMAFNMPEEVTFSFVQGNMFVILNPEGSKYKNYKLKPYGKGTSMLIQSQNLKNNILTCLTIPIDEQFVNFEVIEYYQNQIYQLKVI